MSDIIFEHTDSDDDCLKVEKVFDTDGGEVVYFRTPALGTFLNDDAVTRLREALEPYDPATKDAPAPEPAIEVGREYRLLPGARASVSRGVSSIALDEVTRVLVRYGPDGDGDYYVTALDGNDPGDRYFVLAQYLAPLDEPKPEAIEIGREYRLLPGACFLSGDDECRSMAVRDGVTRVRVASLNQYDGDYFVTALDGANAGDRYRVMAKYLAPLDEAAQVEGVSVDWSIIDEMYTTTAAPTLDPRRVAALEKAAQLVPGNVFGWRDSNAVLDFAAFLLDELADEDTEDDE